MAKSFKLPSGAQLEVTLATLDEGDELFRVMMEEALPLRMDPKAEILDVNLWKDVLCTVVSSKKIRAALKPCLGRVTYKGLKVTADTFEPEDARGDYLEALMHVARENVLPFVKPLLAKYSGDLEEIKAVIVALRSGSLTKSA